MRAFLAAATLLIFLSGAAPDSEYASVPVSSDGDSGRAFVSLVEIESSRGDLEIHPSPATLDPGEQTAPAPASPQTSAAPRTTPSTPPASVPSPPPENVDAVSTPSVPLDRLCDALLTSAQDNGLPVTFFANLIWQESRLRDDAVSRKGALGIAQFMPKVAAETGLQNPFDPLQALSASARFLRGLRDQFGNLGFVAAAYNAGAKRVSEWLQRGRRLPRETRDYILRVTGSSAEQWQKAPPSDDTLRFARRLPCRDLPTFAQLEQMQAAQAEAQQTQAPQVQAAPPQPDGKPPAKVADEAAPAKRRERLAERKSGHPAVRREASRERKHDRGKREAREHIHHASHERHRRV